VEGPAHCFGCHSEIDRDSRPLRPLAGRKGGGQVRPPGEHRPFELVIPNISSDRETGAGTWTDEQLVRAIRQGIGHDGRTLFTFMPYKALRSMSDEDLASIIVYLRTVPPVRNALPLAKKRTEEGSPASPHRRGRTPAGYRRRQPGTPPGTRRSRPGQSLPRSRRRPGRPAPRRR